MFDKPVIVSTKLVSRPRHTDFSSLTNLFLSRTNSSSDKLFPAECGVELLRKLLAVFRTRRRNMNRCVRDENMRASDKLNQLD